MSDPFFAASVCPGPSAFGTSARRGFLRMGLAGFTSLSLPGLLKLRAAAAASHSLSRPADSNRTAVIMVWKPGGCSHIDTYDPKPDAAAEYRGPFSTIDTKIPGMQFTELLPMQAAIADKFTVLRSMRQNAAGHPAGSMQMLSGDPDTRDKPRPRLPDWMSVTNYLRAKQAPRTNPLPAYVGINPPLEYNGPAYLGDAWSPFTVHGDPSNPSFSVPNIGLTDANEVRRLNRRTTLRQNLDTLERAFDRQGELGALDEFEQQALTLLTNPATKDAFDLTREDDRTRDRYGRNTWGQQLLMARRLIEAGTKFVQVNWPSVANGDPEKTAWDTHAANFGPLKNLHCPKLDRSLSALLEDMDQRGLLKETMVVAIGEFGRSPRMGVSTSGNSNSPDGRDHWPYCYSAVVAGAGIGRGVQYGESDATASSPKEKPVHPNDLLATIYYALGIDPEMEIRNHLNQPRELVKGKIVADLFA